MTTLIIARHGNTFGPGDTVTYVGGRTDLPLADKGFEQAKAIGRYLKDHRMIPDVVYSSLLHRTYDTATLAIKASGVSNPVFQLDMFNEIDYGPDENKTREEIVARIGEQALIDWDKKSIPPNGWIINPQEIIQNWKNFAEYIRAHEDNETILVVTSNGIARFAPHITGDYESFAAAHSPKLATGALGIFDYKDGWHLRAWNLSP